MEMWLVTVILLGIVDGAASKRSKTVLGCLASTANNHQQKPWMASARCNQTTDTAICNNGHSRNQGITTPMTRVVLGSVKEWRLIGLETTVVDEPQETKRTTLPSVRCHF